MENNQEARRFLAAGWKRLAKKNYNLLEFNRAVTRREALLNGYYRDFVSRLEYGISDLKNNLGQ